MNFDLHVRAEFAALGRDAMRTQEFDEAVHKRLGDVRQGGVEEGRAPSFARVGVKRELRNDDGFAFDIQNGEICFSLIVFKDAKIGCFFCEELSLLLPIPMTDAQENQQSLSDAGNDLLIDSDAGLGNSLDKDTHKVGNRESVGWVSNSRSIVLR